MKKLINLLALAVFGLSLAAQTNFSAGLEAGYTTKYVQNGRVVATDAGFGALTVAKSYRYVDLDAGAILVVAGPIKQSHYTLGLSKQFNASQYLGLKVEVAGWRHELSSGLTSSTEVRGGVSVPNVVVTPYLLGSYDFDLHQSGVIVGLKRDINVFNLFVATPNVSFSHYSDYETVQASLRLYRTFLNHFTPYVEARFLDDNFNRANFVWKDFAKERANGKLVLTGGLQYSF